MLIYSSPLIDQQPFLIKLYNYLKKIFTHIVPLPFTTTYPLQTSVLSTLLYTTSSLYLALQITIANCSLNSNMPGKAPKKDCF